MSIMVRTRAGALTADDYDRLLAFVGALGEIRDPDEFAEVVPGLVPDIVASDVTSLNDVDPSAATLRSVVHPRTFRIEPAVAEALRELSGSHPLIAHMSATGDGSAIKISDFWSRQIWRDSELYARVYAPLGVEHQMAISLPTALPAVVGLALNRTRADDDFSERDRAALDRLRPHLAQSWRNARERTHVRSLLRTATDALRTGDSHVLLLSDPVTELTPGALVELYRHVGRPSERSVLPGPVLRWLERERGRRRADPTALVRPFMARYGGWHAVVRYLSAAGGGVDALLLSVSESSRLPVQLTGIGLTPRESEILALVTTGASNPAIAARLHLAPATVKRHLEHIYRKLGVNGRVQASALALGAINVARTGRLPGDADGVGGVEPGSRLGPAEPP